MTDRLIRACLLLAFISCGPGKTSEPPPPPPEDVKTGHALYAEQCAACHGPSGEGSATAYPIQNPVHDYATYVIRNGRHEKLNYPGAMAAISTEQLSDADLAKVLAFLDAAAIPTTGEGAYLRFCGNCHGPYGSGGRVGKEIAGEEEDEIFEIAREGHHLGEFSDRKEFMPRWSTERLSQDTLQAIADYLAREKSDAGHDDDDDD